MPVADILNPTKCSSAKCAPSGGGPAKCAGSRRAFDEAGFSEIDLGRSNHVGRTQIRSVPRHLYTHVVEQRINPLMIALECRVGPMHLKQAGNDLRCYNAHNYAPDS